MNISLVKNAKSSKTIPVAVDSVLSSIRDGTYKGQIERIRQKARIGQSYDDDKKQLPGVTWSGTFKKRANSELLEYSGLVVVDLDKCEERIAPAKSALATDSHVFAYFTSPSGTGLKIVYRVPNIPSDHTRHFRMAADRVKFMTGIDADESGKDIARLCFMSYDPGLWHNPNATTLQRDRETELPRDRVTEDTEVMRSLPNCSWDAMSIDDAIKVSMPDEPHRNYDCLFILARACLTLEENNDAKLTLDQRKDIFRKWYDAAKKNGVLRQGQSKDQYMIEFMNACRTAKVPFGRGPAQIAWEAAKIEPSPPEAQQFETAEAIQLVSLCFQMEKISKGKPWFISTRTAAGLTGKSHTQMATWFSAFVEMRIIRIIEPGTAKRATRYRYIL